MRINRVVILLAVAVTAPMGILGLGFRLADQDSFATARGNAFAATADSPAAIYYNPAGITQLKGHNFSAGGYLVHLKSTYQSPAGVRAESRSQVQALPQLYYAYSLDEAPFSFGLGIYAPYGLGLEWGDETGFRNLAKEGRITYLSVNPVAAWRLHPTLSIAAGPTINYSETRLRRGIFVPGDEFRFKGDGSSFGFNAGLLWQPHRQHSFGLSYRGATSVNYTGRSETRLVVPFALNMEESASARIRFPQHIVAGWSYRPTPNWNLEFNLDWTDWDRLNTVTLRQPSGDAEMPFNWRSSFFYEWGATRYFEGGYSVSGGYIFSENSVPTGSFNPMVPDSDRHIFSAGVGRQWKRYRWHAAYQFAYGPWRSVTGSPAHLNPVIGAVESADGRYRFLSHAITATLGYSF